MVLLGKEQKDPRYSAVVREYERLVYPSDEPTPEGLAKGAALKAAMQDIARLAGNDLAIQTKIVPLTWAREWFERLGGLPDNPVDCFQFGYSCMQLWIAVAETGTAALCYNLHRVGKTRFLTRI